MKVSFPRSFERDLKKIEDPSLLKPVKQVVLQAEKAKNLREISNLKKLALNMCRTDFLFMPSALSFL